MWSTRCNMLKYNYIISLISHPFPQLTQKKCRILAANLSLFVPSVQCITYVIKIYLEFSNTSVSLSPVSGLDTALSPAGLFPAPWTRRRTLRRNMEREVFLSQHFIIYHPSRTSIRMFIFALESVLFQNTV